MATPSGDRISPAAGIWTSAAVLEQNCPDLGASNIVPRLKRKKRPLPFVASRSAVVSLAKLSEDQTSLTIRI